MYLLREKNRTKKSDASVHLIQVSTSKYPTYGRAMLRTRRTVRTSPLLAPCWRLSLQRLQRQHQVVEYKFFSNSFTAFSKYVYKDWEWIYTEDVWNETVCTYTKNVEWNCAFAEYVKLCKSFNRFPLSLLAELNVTYMYVCTDNTRNTRNET
jgi:hypothetical protein